MTFLYYPLYTNLVSPGITGQWLTELCLYIKKFMQRRFDSNNNRIRIQIDRSVEVRKQKSSHISP